MEQRTVKFYGVQTLTRGGTGRPGDQLQVEASCGEEREKLRHRELEGKRVQIVSYQSRKTKRTGTDMCSILNV